MNQRGNYTLSKKEEEEITSTKLIQMTLISIYTTRVAVLAFLNTVNLWVPHKVQIFEFFLKENSIEFMSQTELRWISGVFKLKK